MEQTKVCTSCGIEYELNEQNFHRRDKPHSKDGFKGTCKICCHNKNKLYLENNKEKTTERKRKYRKENKDILNEKRKIYNENNFEKLSETRKIYSEKNKEHLVEQHRIYRLNHKDKHRINQQNRKSRKNEVISELTEKQWDFIKNSFDNKCCYCGKDQPLEQEHFIPLSKGGEYTNNNIIPSCKSCNCSKYNKPFETWYPKYKYYNKDREQKILKFLGYKNNIQQLTLAI